MPQPGQMRAGHLQAATHGHTECGHPQSCAGCSRRSNRSSAAAYASLSATNWRRSPVRWLRATCRQHQCKSHTLYYRFFQQAAATVEEAHFQTTRQRPTTLTMDVYRALMGPAAAACASLSATNWRRSLARWLRATCRQQHTTLMMV
jgi:hypothetical protein